MAATTIKDSIKELWLLCHKTVLRTALACTIISCTTLYGPASLQQILTYPSFSYMTTILILADSKQVTQPTLGDAIRGCWRALYAIMQVIVPSMGVLWMIGPARFTVYLAALAVAIGSLIVALPESTSLLAERIAFGQLVILYVGVVVQGPQTPAIMHPVHVGSSTALGALATVLAMLAPYPQLASFEVRKSCRQYVANALERLNLFVEALSVQNAQRATELISQVKQLSETGSKHLQSIKDAQSGMIWEKPQMQLLKPYHINLGGSLQLMELLLTGMEVALTLCPSLPVEMVNEELRETLMRAKGKIEIKLKQAKCIAPFNVTTAPTTEQEHSDKFQWSPQTSSISDENLPVFFFFCCLELLKDEIPTNCRQERVVDNKPGIGKMENTEESVECKLRKILNGSMRILSRQRWTFAIRSSVSLGFSVLFGLICIKENGYWSGLTVAISLVTGRQATFAVSIARARGTAIGSVYGIICRLIFHRFQNLCFLPLLPWIIFTSFLRRNKKYGQSGMDSAVIGALLILGRKNYGPPIEFAIDRITEVGIGLICFIMVGYLVQPARAASLSKEEIAFSLKALGDCIKDIVVNNSQTRISYSNSPILGEKQKKLKFHVDKLENFIAEAKLEPSFWFPHFHAACYDKLLGSFRKLNDLVVITAYILQALSQAQESLGIEDNELKHIDDDLVIFGEQVSSLLKCPNEMISKDSLADLEREVQNKSKPHDIELGNSSDTDTLRSTSIENDTSLEIIGSFINHWAEVTNKINAYKEDEQKLKSQIVVFSNGLGFCISRFIKETKEIEKQLKELIILENPTMQSNMSRNSIRKSKCTPI